MVVDDEEADEEVVDDVEVVADEEVLDDVEVVADEEALDDAEVVADEEDSGSGSREDTDSSEEIGSSELEDPSCSSQGSKVVPFLYQPIKRFFCVLPFLSS